MMPNRPKSLAYHLRVSRQPNFADRQLADARRIWTYLGNCPYCKNYCIMQESLAAQVPAVVVDQGPCAAEHLLWEFHRGTVCCSWFAEIM